MKIVCLFLPLLIILSSCKSTPTNVAADFKPTSEKGVAIATITFEGDKPVNEIYRFFYSAQNGDKAFKKRNAGKVVISGSEVKDSFNGDFNNKKSYLVVIEREPGQYAFTQYGFLDHKGSNGMVSSSRLFSIPFEIKKGEITYIGELDYKDVVEKGTPRIYVADYFDRDLPEFKKKYPMTDWEKAINKSVKAGDTGGGIVDFR
ncbi:hypothetical protein GR160_05010 [Flavobacterium sp. Sd200]|uniref:hypothetical protein n=1 Tax=Flavobacterium sp. Sd200 TaxID=2692211 RepID=UPI0013696A62|nr:hypothetical protein [Flavobacterium sp. Sd200]MXN90577.1 hypothetical protein [Flavobacterium sp. Sd200]